MTAAKTPVTTPLGEVAELLKDIQVRVLATTATLPLAAANSMEPLLEINDKLAQARILVDVLRGDGQ